ncbi:MAG: DoxX family protein [Geodermatophilaceae bacterium]|nr:DoxX family protein [Geodermatophilaceae bacterium]
MTIASKRTTAIRNPDLALLMLRVVVGIVFLGHGAQKLFGAFSGGGLDGTARMMSGIGLQPGMLFAVLGGTIEFGGGLLLIIGVLTRLVGLALVGNMVVAIALVTGRNGFFIQNQGYEFNLTLIAIALALVIAGPGQLSLDHWFGIDTWVGRLWRRLSNR